LILRIVCVFPLYAWVLCPQSSGPRESFAAAQKAEQSRDWTRAEAIYRKIMEDAPSAEIYQRLGLVEHLQNKFSDAAKAFEKALKLDPKLWTSHLFLGIDNYRMNRFADALSHLTFAERLHPGETETSFWLGATNLALHQYWNGFEYLEAVLAKDPANPDALRLLAESYASRGTQILNQIAEKYPDSAAGLQVQGRAFEFEGSYEAALQCYRQAAAKEPQRPDIQEAITRLTGRNR
jgi:protein O-GlcNAc transferase